MVLELVFCDTFVSMAGTLSAHRSKSGTNNSRRNVTSRKVYLANAIRVEMLPVLCRKS